MMDIRRKVLNGVRRIVAPTSEGWYRGGLPLLDAGSANGLLHRAMLADEPFMAARFGSVEIKPTLYYLLLKDMGLWRRCINYVRGDIDYVFDDERYIRFILGNMCTFAGFFPGDEVLMERFAHLMDNDMKEMDLCGCWLNEKLLRDRLAPEVQFCELGALEPYDQDIPWTGALAGKRVLVVHPFATSIRSQYERRQRIWPGREVLPDFELKTLRAVQSIAGERTDFTDWFEALESMKSGMDAVEYDVALIGCGAYGMPLAAHAKRTGHKAVHLGGPLQILFGIKGKRWDDLPSVSGYYNDAWIYPLAAETPSGSGAVEGGCYWK